MGNIVLQSDYGLGNGTGDLHGVCKQVDMALLVYDLTHDIPGLDVAAASDNLARAVAFWPAGTVFVSCVDPATGTEHRICAAETANGCYILTADNGALSGVRDTVGLTAVRDITALTKAYPAGTTALLHGRDLAWCAALLASGQRPFAQMGEAYPLGQLAQL